MGRPSQLERRQSGAVAGRLPSGSAASRCWSAKGAWQSPAGLW